MIRSAEQLDVTLLHENEKGIYGDTAERCVDLLENFNHPRFRAVFDPANFIQVGVEPFPHAWNLLGGYVAYVHVKDVVRANGRVTAVDHGDGRWLDFIQALNDRNFSGFLSMEPHLGGPSSEEGGSRSFIHATKALKALLPAGSII